MSDHMALTLTLPSWALAVPSVAALLKNDPPEELIPGPDDTTDVFQSEASWGEWPELESLLVAEGIAFDRHSSAPPRPTCRHAMSRC
jgi:hypothetical protein